MYACQFPFFERYKTVNEPWAWQSADPKERAAFWSLLRYGCGIVLFNNICVAGPLAYLSSRQPRNPIALEEWPSLMTVLWQVAACLVIEDFLF